MDRDYPWTEVEQEIQDGLWEEAQAYYEFEADVQEFIANLPMITDGERNTKPRG